MQRHRQLSYIVEPLTVKLSYIYGVITGALNTLNSRGPIQLDSINNHQPSHNSRYFPLNWRLTSIHTKSVVFQTRWAAFRAELRTDDTAVYLNSLLTHSTGSRTLDLTLVLGRTCESRSANKQQQLFRLCKAGAAGPPPHVRTCEQTPAAEATASAFFVYRAIPDNRA